MLEMYSKSKQPNKINAQPGGTMAKSTASRQKPKKSEQTFVKVLAGATMTLILVYFVQSTLLIADKHPIKAALANYDQQVQLEKQ